VQVKRLAVPVTARLNPWDDQLAAVSKELNAEVQALLAARHSVFQYYELVDVRWPLHPSAPSVAGGEGSAPESVPIYICAGAVIPHRELEQFVGQLNTNPLSFDVYPGPDSTHNVYLDDKVSTQAQTNGVYRLTQVSQSLRSGNCKVQTVRVLRTYDHFTPNERYYFVAMLDTSPPMSVMVNGKKLTLIQTASDSESAAQLTASAVDACYYNASLHTTFVKLFDAEPDTRIVGTFHN
jgi:alpha-glucosidase